jgi:hypothetical protein
MWSFHPTRFILTLSASVASAPEAADRHERPLRVDCGVWAKPRERPLSTVQRKSRPEISTLRSSVNCRRHHFRSVVLPADVVLEIPDIKEPEP